MLAKTMVAALTLFTAALVQPASSSAQTLTTLYSFKGGHDGSEPSAGLTYYHGLLYGTTGLGGKTGNGTVFSVKAANGKEKVLYAFKGGSDGSFPLSAVTIVDDVAYGTTKLGGGGSGLGTVFAVDLTTGTESVIHSFGSGSDGAAPFAGVINQGNILYGTTSEGGNNEIYGTIFALDVTTGVESVIYNFLGGGNGNYPLAGLIYNKGVLYGTTNMDGSGPDTVFGFNVKTGIESVLHSFSGQNGGASDIVAGVILQAGLLYGTSHSGGVNGYGTVFALNPVTGTEAVIYSFAGGSDGQYPNSGLVYSNGLLYGTTSLGGGTGCFGQGCGTVYAIDIATLTGKVLYSFSGNADGAYPDGTLLYQNGAFYGTALAGGATQNGDVFKFTP